MSVLRVALLQMTAYGTNQDANLAKGEAFCRRAAELGADIALFPEMWNVGYTFEGRAPSGVIGRKVVAKGADNLWRAPELWRDGDAPAGPRLREAIRWWQERAIGRDGGFVRHFRSLAKELGMAIALTYLERWDGPPRNSVSLIDRRGEIAMTYAKIHTCDFSLAEASLTPGDDFYVCDLETAVGPVRIGAMICYDREFPESARILMLKGAEIVLTPNACDLEANRIGQFRARAYENMIGVAMANYAAPQHNGHSVAFDPIAFDETEHGRDPLIVEAGEAEGIVLAPFDLDQLRDYRRRETWGNAFRRPHRYALLTAPPVNAPFVRVDAAGEAYQRVRR